MSLVSENQNLRQKTDEEWINDIEALPENIKTAVAKIVYWDWMGGRPANEQNPLFQKFIKYSPEPCTESELINGLLEVGYSEFQATKRIRRGL